MPLTMKIQPIDSQPAEERTLVEQVKPVVKSRLKRLFERQFSKISNVEKVGGGVEEVQLNKDGLNCLDEFEPSSICLANMVQNFIEENTEKQSDSVRCGQKRCNCFNGNCIDSSDDEFELYDGFSGSNYYTSFDACEIVKSLVHCASVRERNLLIVIAKIVEKNKICKRKDNACRKFVVNSLLSLGYDASICKSRWEKSSYPAGEYEYLDVIIEDERLLIDIDFRSEFEIARSTKAYKAVLQALPYIFVGKVDRLQKIVGIVSDAAKHSLKKKGMHIPPWRKAEYVKAKWLSPYTRIAPPLTSLHESDSKPGKHQNSPKTSITESSHIDRNSVDDTELGESFFAMSEPSSEDDKTLVSSMASVIVD